MKRETGFLPAFFVVIFFCVVILALSISGKLNFLTSFLEKGVSGIQAAAFSTYQKLPFVAEDKTVKKLEAENQNLASQLAALAKLKSDNQALSDQFQTSYPQSTRLLEAEVVGAPGLIPGVSVPDTLIINKGTSDNVRKGESVIVRNNLVGVISQVSANLSKVNLINNSSLSLTAKTQDGIAGVFRGGDPLILDNILLSDNIKAGELVLTKGDMSIDGVGILPNLTIGKIASVEKNPSDLFQRARVESLVNLANLTSVFISMQIK